ncbi:class C beta-lactamase [Caballeronia sp. LZ035]|uniref:class C beta-lactamase n=1 Tax=Caballeronia sp. LZ035 TaxID=3038568 RepID=UPI0028588364|nr:class C beta-lactamase [Caballeronia sp. LZ035]MDR5760779.1 beta-lactamase [Caballeronia sp. LZ035]
MKIKLCKILCLALASFSFGGASSAAFAASPGNASVQQTVDATIKPLMALHGIAGMAVGVVVGGRAYVFDYGVASKETKQPVTRDTLFELGSVSKTFTATLASYAQTKGDLSLNDPVGKYLPSLNGSAFGKVTLLNLGTHTPGGLPLQVPDDIHDNAQLLQYFGTWRPPQPPGTVRTYSNPGIGTLGLITAKAMNQDFDALMQTRLFPALGLTHTYMHVPAAKQRDYAQGYAKDDRPIRMQAGVLSSEAYGVRTTAADMTRFMQINMNQVHQVRVDPAWQRAVTATHTGYFKAGPMTQDLIWEQYPYPAALPALLEGNGQAMILNATPVTAIDPPQPPRDDVWINKTGSTNGFGTYIAFVPSERVGIVMLANRNIPNDDRVKAAYAIITALTGAPQNSKQNDKR